MELMTLVLLLAGLATLAAIAALGLLIGVATKDSRQARGVASQGPHKSPADIDRGRDVVMSSSIGA
jgi:hypothetical protein